jgi:hypothetical protein
MKHNGAQLLGRTGNAKTVLRAVKTILVLKPLNRPPPKKVLGRPRGKQQFTETEI